MCHLFQHCLLLISPSFGASGSLIVAFPEYLYCLIRSKSRNHEHRFTINDELQQRISPKNSQQKHLGIKSTLFILTLDTRHKSL